MEGNYTHTYNTSTIPSVFSVCKAVLKRRFSASDLGVPYRWIYHWDEKELLFSASDNDGSWRKFNFIDFLWIEIIVELRKLGLSLDSIYELKQLLGTQLEMDDTLLNDWFNTDVNQLKGDDKSYLNVLLLLIAECLSTGADIFLLIDENGECIIYNENTNDNHDSETYYFRQKTHLSLSLRHILVQFITKYKLVDELTTLSLVDPNEFEIISLIRDDKLKNIIVERHEVPDLILDEEALSDKNRAEYLLVDSILHHSYRSVSYTTTDRKKVSFEKEFADA